MRQILIVALLFLSVAVLSSCCKNYSETIDTEETNSASEISSIELKISDVSSESTDSTYITSAQSGSIATDVSDIPAENSSALSTEMFAGAVATEDPIQVETTDSETTSTQFTVTTETASFSDTASDVTTDSVAEKSPYGVLATADTADLLAERMIYYINKYREEEGCVTATILPGLSEFCVYRSCQLVDNFAHDMNDIRAAATELQYGQYIDPALYGLTGEPYYQGGGREAIGRGFMRGETIDELAKRISSGFRNSAGHWNYIGAQTRGYKYVGAGITIQGGMWYCCVSVSEVNEDKQS